MLIPTVLFVSLLQTTFSNQCNEDGRSPCENYITAVKNNALGACTDIWKNSYWSKIQTDSSAQCRFCLNTVKNSACDKIGIQPMLSRLCSLNNSITLDRCSTFLKDMTGIASIQERSIVTCNALTWCKSHIYLGNLNFGGELCNDCKQVVTVIRDLVASNSTSEEISHELKNLICSHVCDHVRDYCERVVDIHVPELLRLIEIHLDPTDICTLLHLCPGAEGMQVQFRDLLPAKSYAEEEQPTTAFSWIKRPSPMDNPKWTSYSRDDALATVPSCDECTAVFTQVKTSLQDAQLQVMIKQNLMNLCSSVPMFKTLCEREIDEHFEEALRALDSVDPKKACSMFGMCPQLTVQMLYEQASTKLNFRRSSIPGACEVCDIVTEKLFHLFFNNATEESIKEGLDKVCSLVPVAYKSVCDKFVQKYAGEIIKAIIDKTAPRLFCLSIGLCKFPYHCSPLPTISKPVVKTAKCDTCKIMVQVAEMQLKENTTEAELKMVLSKLCHLLPKSFVDECNILLDAYLPAILDYLANALTPEEVCTQIGMCGSDPSHVDPNICRLGPSVWCSTPSLTKLCNAAEFCTDYHADILQSGLGALCTTTDLDQMCSNPVLSFSCGKSTECMHRQMSKYLNLVTDARPQTGDAPFDRLNCTVCEQLVNGWELQMRLFSGPIINEHTCNIFPIEEDNILCKRVRSNANTLLQNIKAGKNNHAEVCKKFHLCSVSTRPAMPTPPKTDTQTALLLACAEGLTFSCSSRRAAELCGTLITCSALRGWDDAHPVVTDKPKNVDLLGSDVCSWGPSYYCASEANALYCGGPELVEKCRKDVWLSNDPHMSLNNRASDVGSNPCAWGQTYWCANPELARACGKDFDKECHLANSLIHPVVGV